MQFPLTLTSEFLKRSYAKRMFGDWRKMAIAAVLVGVVVVWEMMRGPIGVLSLFALSAIALYLVMCCVAWFGNRGR